MLSLNSCGGSDKPPPPNNTTDPSVTLNISYNQNSPCHGYFASGGNFKYDLEILYDHDDALIK